MERETLHQIPVRNIMRSDVITIHPEELVADAAQLMGEFNIRRLPVVDEDGCLVGIITDSDVREAETAGSLRNSYEPGAGEEWLAVADAMTREVITTGPDATLGELAALLVKHKIGGMPVVEQDPRFPKRSLLIGIITETDIFARIADAWRQDQIAQN